MEATPQWISSNEAARYLGVNLRTLYRLIDEGAIPAYRFGRVIRLKAGDLEGFIEQSRIVPSAAPAEAAGPPRLHAAS